MPDGLGPLARAARAIARARGLHWDQLPQDVREQMVREAKAVLTEINGPKKGFRVVDQEGHWMGVPIWTQFNISPSQVKR